MRLVVVGFVALFWSSISAQIQNRTSRLWPENQQHSASNNAHTALDIKAYLNQNHQILSLADYDVRLRDSVTSLTGTHYHYDVFYRGIHVLDAEYHAHIRNGKVWMVQESIPLIQNDVTPESVNPVWININGQWEVAERSIANDQIIIKLDHCVLHTQDNRLYYHTPDTFVNAKVFLVNPLNSAEKDYGSPYIDSNDVDIPELNAERKWVKMKAHFENDTFWLRHPRYWFEQISDPKLPETFSLTDTFDFTRSQYQFEDVNAFYHVVSMSDYVESLGFESALADTLIIDAHAYSGGDFSSFNYGVSPVELEFGEGGVDDAEDGEIVVHEFAHSLSHFAGGDSYANTTDRSAMEEGNADYFSASYSKVYTDFAWDKMFNWDGHNQFWDGISIGTQLTYPNDLTGNTNADREMWSTPLMCLYDKIGRGPTDTLVLEHLYYQSKTGTMPQMANVILQIDSMVFNGKYEDDIRDCFASHNILASVPDALISAGPWLVRNTNGFTFKGESVFVQSTNNENFSVVIYDQSGQLVMEVDNRALVEITPHRLESGIYFVELKSDAHRAFFKLLKP